MDHLATMMKRHVPTKLGSKKFHQPWINTKLKRLSRQKHRAWTKAKKSNLPQHWEKYNWLKKEVRRANRIAYQAHVKTLVEEESGKNLWKFIKSKRRDPVGVAPLSKEGMLHAYNQDKANVPNQQFCSVFVSEDCTNIPLTPDRKHPMMSDRCDRRRSTQIIAFSEPEKSCWS